MNAIKTMFSFVKVLHTIRPIIREDVVGVFTKDVSYYVGFEKVVTYIHRLLLSGQTIHSIMDYVLDGRFDPEEASHVRYRSDVKIKANL
jgi:hypothetical protein